MSAAVARLQLRRVSLEAFYGLRPSAATQHVIDSSKCVFSDDGPQAQVLNQAKMLQDFNVFTSDKVLQETVESHGGKWAFDKLAAAGNVAGSYAFMDMAKMANQNMPVLRTHDEQGRRVDFVQYHPAYHAVIGTGLEHEVHSLGWSNRDKPGQQVARSAMGYIFYQAESGTGCPQTMTFAAVPALRHCTAEQLKTCDWLAKATTPQYDPRDIPATMKEAVTLGMSMTERQGGSDVRANITTAKPIDPSAQGPGQGYFLNGHKWFTSAPMCDAFLTLAQTESGLSCFLVPRFVPHSGERNKGLRFQRLKDKLGDRSNASSEIEYHNAYGEMLGKEGKGIATILEMVQHTRLDCTVGSAALMRRCVAIALHHVSQRKAFGHRLLDTPLMKNVAADLSIESEAATKLGLRIASTFNHEASEEDKALSRIATAVAKYYICKRAPNLAYESMECLGGNGYVEETGMAIHFRQSPLNAIWEGSGNVICLDVLRCLAREPDAVEALRNELAVVHGRDERYDKALKRVEKGLADHAAGNISNLRDSVGTLAILLQAKCLMESSPDYVAEPFLASRLNPAWRSDYGTLPSNTAFDDIVNRHIPSDS